MDGTIDIAKHPVKIFSYEHVLVAHKRDAFFLSNLCKFADKIGYEKILWNNIIYEKNSDGCWMRTPYTKEYIR